jgi:hypothetical protein
MGKGVTESVESKRAMGIEVMEPRENLGQWRSGDGIKGGVKGMGEAVIGGGVTE